MNYFTTDNPPRGEVCTRGPSVFRGYYLDEVNTKETVDEEGWNHSGDVGVILPNGALKIVDRKKNIYKLSQGEYIAPEKVENIYLRCPYVAECFIYGDSLRDYNVAVIHPNLDVLQGVAQKLGIKDVSPDSLTKNSQIEEFVLKEMTEHGKKEGLFGFELAKKVKLWPVSFGTLGVFTSTMKLQRHIAKAAFKAQIE